MAAAKLATKFAARSLPLFTKIAKGSLPIMMQNYEPKYFDEVQKLYVEAAEKGEGYTKEEVAPDAMKQKLEESTLTLLYLEEQSKEVLCVNIFSDSPVCRSTNTLLGSTSAVVHPKVRGKGVVRESYVLSFPYTIRHGYLGVASRVALTARNAIPTLAIGSQIYTTIPMCTPLEKFGLIDDLVICIDNQVKKRFPEYYEELMDIRRSSLEPLKTDEKLLSKFIAKQEYPVEDVKTDAGMIQIRPVQNTREALETECMWRAAADENTCGVDEFDENGHFNRQLFRSSDVVFAESATSGEIVGASIIGPSKLTRTKVSLLAQQYITVKKDVNKEAIAKALLKYGISNIRSQGYKGMLSDIYPTNFYQTELFRTHNFAFKGSLPYCGFLKESGPSPSLLVYLPV